MQVEAEPGVRGRVFGSYFALFGFAQFVGMACSGVLGDALGVMVINVDTAAYLLAGAVVLIATSKRLPDGGEVGEVAPLEAKAPIPRAGPE